MRDGAGHLVIFKLLFILANCFKILI